MAGTTTATMYAKTHSNDDVRKAGVKLSPALLFVIRQRGADSSG